MALTQLSLPHIRDAEHEAELVVALRNDTLSREDDCRCAFTRACNLREHHAQDERIDHQTYQCLERRGVINKTSFKSFKVAE